MSQNYGDNRKEQPYRGRGGNGYPKPSGKRGTPGYRGTATNYKPDWKDRNLQKPPQQYRQKPEELLEQKGQWVEDEAFITEEETKQVPIRKTYTKQQLLRAFQQNSELDFQVFDKQSLTENIFLFNDAQDGKGIIPENLQQQTQLTTPVQSIPQKHKVQYEEEEENPVWVNFDPKKEGKFNLEDVAMPDENSLREKYEKFKRPNKTKAQDKDAYDEMIQEQDIGEYSDVDVRVSKKLQQQKNVMTQELDDDELENLFGNEEEEQESENNDNSKDDDVDQAIITPEPPVEEKKITSMQLTKMIKDQIQELERQQQQQLKANQLQEHQKSQFTADQNLERLFQFYPVVNTQSAKIRLDEIGKFQVPDQEIEEQKVELTKTSLFEKLMGSINPFSQYIIREMKDHVSNAKLWELQPSIFQKPVVDRQNLVRSSSEMFVIYKFTNDPLMQVKSDVYTQGKFVSVKDLFPVEEQMLFETSVLHQIKLKEQFKQQQADTISALNSLEFKINNQ